MNDWRETALCALLDCGSDDLSLLDDFTGDIYEVIQDCKQEFGDDMNINNVVRVIFDIGTQELQSFVDGRIAELEGREELSEEEDEELDALRQCEPYEDVRSYHNYLDTSVWIDEHAEIYAKYVRPGIEAFEELTGFSFSNMVAA